MLCEPLHMAAWHWSAKVQTGSCLCSGILVTGTVVLEALAQCGTAAFDKTGTLTTGRLAATSMRRPDTAAAANGAAPEHSGNGGERILIPSSQCMTKALVRSAEPERLVCRLPKAFVLLSSPASSTSNPNWEMPVSTYSMGSADWRGRGAAIQGIGRKKCMPAAAKRTLRRWTLPLHCPRGLTTLFPEHSPASMACCTRKGPACLSASQTFGQSQVRTHL